MVYFTGQVAGPFKKFGNFIIIPAMPDTWIPLDPATGRPAGDPGMA